MNLEVGDALERMIKDFNNICTLSTFLLYYGDSRG